MKDLFKKLYEQKELPKALENEIFKSYDSLLLFAEVSDLFTSKMGKTEAELFSGIEDYLNDESDENNPDDELN